jgi:hypothetical protein
MSVKPIAFKIDSSSDKLYYNSKDLNLYDPEFYYGCKTKPRTIIQKKKIPESEYIFANLKLKEWNISTVDCKKAQLLISKSWVDKYFFKPVQPSCTNFIEKNIEALNPVKMASNTPVNLEEDSINNKIEPTVIQDDKDIIEKAPPILHLLDEDKFKDCDGNIIEIETRGEKHKNKIFFKVKDVMTAFNMPYLNHTLVDKAKNFENKIHYINFIREKKQNSKNINSYNCKTTLYLTYYGFLRVINVSKSNFFLKNINIINRWLDNLINNKYFDNYILSNVIDDFSGVVYICSSQLIDATKIGYWTGSISGLKSRYKMVYGKDVFLICKSVENVHIIETEIHSKFKEFNISGELFQKDKLQLYIDYFNDCIVEYEAGNCKEEYDGVDEMKLIDNKMDEEPDEEDDEELDEEGDKGTDYEGVQTYIIKLKDKIKDFENEIVNLKMSHKNELLEKDMSINREINEKHLLKMQLEVSNSIFWSFLA